MCCIGLPVFYGKVITVHFLVLEINFCIMTEAIILLVMSYCGVIMFPLD